MTSIAGSECPIDPVLYLGAVALLGGALLIASAPVAGLLVVGTWVVRRRLRRWALALGVLLSMSGAWRARAQLAEAEAQREVVLDALTPPRRCAISFDVLSSPVVLTPREGARAPGYRARIDVRIQGGTCGEALEALPLGITVRLYGAPEELTRGTWVSAVVDLGALRAFDNPGATDPRVRQALLGVSGSGVIIDSEVLVPGRGLPAAVDRARARVRARIEHTFARSVVPHARALVLGENDMSDHERLAFRTSGLSHLLAVSGTHLILAVLALGRLVRALLARCEPLAARWDVGRLSAALCIPACWLYADFAGGGGSAYRAAAMLTVAMGARAAGRRPSAQRAFAWSLLGAGLLQPLAMFDLSFGLSVAATTGLLVWGRSPAEDRKGWQRALGLGVAAARATAAATIACLPIVLTVNGELPVLSVVANLLAGPLGELAALPLCLLHAVVWWLPSVEAGAALLGSGALTAVRAVAHAAADSGAMIELPPPTAWQLITLVLAGVVIEGQGLARAKHRWKTMALAALILGLLEGCAMLAGAPPGELRVTALDVGQGDAILVDLPDGRVMLVDGGGLVGSPINTGERVVLEVLRARRRRALDVVVLSHPHPDHYGGLLTVLSRLPVGELWISGLETQSVGPVTTAIHDAAKRGTRVRLTRELCGNPQSFGAARVDVLGPCPTFDRAASVNDNSVVLRVALGRRAALLAGDAEAPQEARLLAAHGQRLRADLLKVGHHGSRTSTSEAWLDAVGPTTAMISCGVRNRFGHPHAPTLRHLARFWVAVFRTDRGGAVVWQTDGIRWGAAHHRSSLQMEEH